MRCPNSTASDPCGVKEALLPCGQCGTTPGPADRCFCPKCGAVLVTQAEADEHAAGAPPSDANDKPDRRSAMREPYYTCCEDGMLSQVPPTDRSGLCPACRPNRPDVRPVNPGDALGRCFDCMWAGKSSCPHTSGVQGRIGGQQE